MPTVIASSTSRASALKAGSFRIAGLLRPVTTQMRKPRHVVPASALRPRALRSAWGHVRPVGQEQCAESRAQARRRAHRRANQPDPRTGTRAADARRQGSELRGALSETRSATHDVQGEHDGHEENGCGSEHVCVHGKQYRQDQPAPLPCSGGRRCASFPFLQMAATRTGLARHSGDSARAGSARGGQPAGNPRAGGNRQRGQLHAGMFRDDR